MVKAAALMLLSVLASPAPAATWDSAAQPVYQAAESFSDGVYAFLSRSEGAPQATSYGLFAEQLQVRQERAQRLIIEALPAGPVSSGALDAWRGRVIAEEGKALTDTFAATFAARYDLKRFSLASMGSAGDSGDWDAGRCASTAVLGAAYAYAAGLRADLSAGPVRFDVDVNSGEALRRSSEDGRTRRLATLRLSPKGSPFFLETAWGLRDGRVGRERVGLDYSSRF